MINIKPEKNDYKLNIKDDYGLYGIGYCYNTGNEFYFDMDDYDKIKNYHWMEHIQDSKYHVLEAAKGKSHIRMHWLIIGKYVDHIDRNPLNNRKYNLRKATVFENNRNKRKNKLNTSGIIGVSWDKESLKWRSYINFNKKQIKLGRFTNKNDAIIARLKAEMKYFKEFAPQRHLFEQYGISIDNQENL